MAWLPSGGCKFNILNLSGDLPIRQLRLDIMTQRRARVAMPTLSSSLSTASLRDDVVTA